MLLKLQAHDDSRIWSLQSTVSFFFLSSIWYSEVLFAFKLGLQRVYFFQNVRKMHIFPMFRNGVKCHKCHIHQTRFAALRSLMCTYSVCSEFLALRTKSSASMALTKKKTNKQKNNNKTKHPPPKKRTTKINKKQQKTATN